MKACRTSSRSSRKRVGRYIVSPGVQVRADSVRACGRVRKRLALPLAASSSAFGLPAAGLQRQSDQKTAPAVGHDATACVAAVAAGNLAHQREPETGAGTSRGTGRAIERPEHILELLGR